MKGKVKVSLVILEILIALGILAVPLFWVQRIAQAASTGNAMMSYWDAGAVDYDLPRYRTWNGSSWSNEATAQDINSSPYWIVLKSCPKRNEKILGTQDATSASEDVEVQVWNGTTQTWGNYKKASDDTGTTSKRAFDIAYEQSSGDAIVVFGVDTITTPKYFSWNGSEWGTVAEDCAAIGGGEVNWVRMASKPGADEIVLVTQDTSNDIYAQVWDGSSWGNATHLGVTEVTTNQGFDVAYEQSSGRALVVYVNMNLTDYIPYYSIWDGSSGASGEWVSGGEAASRGGYDLRWFRLASKPGSNQIMLGTLDDDYDIHAEIWYSGNTEGWSMYTGDLTQNSGKYDKRVFDVAYESSSGEGIIVYRDNDLDAVKYSIWTGSAWTAGGSTSSPTAGALPHWVKLVSNPDTDEIMLMTSNAIDGAQYDDEYNVQKWNGSAWGTISTVETAGYTKYESFAIDYDRHSAKVSIVIQKWRELYH